jgi:hypothetical protein
VKLCAYACKALQVIRSMTLPWRTLAALARILQAGAERLIYLTELNSGNNKKFSNVMSLSEGRTINNTLANAKV